MTGELNEDQLRTLVKVAVTEALHAQREQLENIVAESVKQTLTALGIDSSNPLEMQKDMQHLRDWRQSVNQIRNKSMMTVIGIVVTGLVGAVWVGIQHFLKG